MRRSRLCGKERAASVEKIMEVLTLCTAQGVRAASLGVPILAEEFLRTGTA